MIDIKALEKPGELDQYRKNLQARGGDIQVVQQLVDLNGLRKKAITESEQVRAEQNRWAQSVGQLKREGKDASEALQKSSELGEKYKQLEAHTKEIDEKVHKLASTLPNRLNAKVPSGGGAEGNQEIKIWGSPIKHSFKALEHSDIGEKLGLIDAHRAAKVAGARFAFLKGKGALLERAIGQYFLDLHTQNHGYTELIAPYIVNSASYFGTGQFPKFLDEVFHLKDTDYHLISTAEVPVTNYYRDEILKEEDLPQKFCAFSPCFRSEAGAAGRDTKGLIRQHQFHKVELMVFAHPDSSYELHEQLTLHAEKCLHELELPYKRMLLCSGDIGFSSAMTYDLEVWMAGAGTYREISSCSNFEDFQARRANIRFKSTNGKPQFVHTINGSGLAVGRTLVAILENYQREDGSVAIPKVLHRYTGGLTEIR